MRLAESMANMGNRIGIARCVQRSWVALFLLLGGLASPRASVDATPIFPWLQEGHDAAHTWSNGGPSPAVDLIMQSANEPPKAPAAT
jgi:hypothetical protein